MQLDQLYQDIILDHYKRPRGRGLRELAASPDGGLSGAEAHHVNPTCGDEITVRVALAGDKIEDVSYDGMGCSISQASASVLHELLVGKTVPEAFARVDAFSELVGGRGQVEPDEALLEDGVAFAGVARFPARVKCALLAWMAFKDAAARALAGSSETVSAETVSAETVEVSHE
jgi:nitrogen fixation NifU-like protein